MEIRDRGVSIWRAERPPESKECDRLPGIATILLVDDEPVTREAMVRLLEAADFRVFDTYNGQDAL